MSLWILLAIMTAGATGGFLDSLAGMGFGALSGTVMMAAGISPAIAVATVNVAKVGSGIASGVSHWSFGNIRWQWVLPLGLPAVVAGVLAALALTHLPMQAVRVVVPVLLLVVGLLILRRFIYEPVLLPPIAGGSQGIEIMQRRPPWRALMDTLAGVSPRVRLGSIGFLGGLLNGFSGAFGPFTTSALVLQQGGHPRFAIGTANFVEVFVAASVSVTLLTQLSWAD
ncbi:MAG: sulfite exporter TauE/SafE family protein, partial [Dehalococcoidia bacterium]|nr:sulfite exporter TauE/SafE family protein [Dehalococcoidia bacterium]